ncbi:MAG TPA: GNAT family N-acetyltransferase [Solirubrobacterales bacterium]
MAAASPSARLATPRDAADAGRLLHDFNTEFDERTPGAEALAERIGPMIADGEATVLLAGEGPDGVAVLRFRRAIFEDGLYAYLEELYVAPRHRGEGLGRALLEAAMQAARERGAVFIELGTSEDDVAARGLYESAGFTNREGGTGGPVMFVYEREL